MEGMMDCLREEMMMNMPVLPETTEPAEHHIVYHHIHSNLSGKQAHSIENNTNQILAVKRILNTLIERRRPKSKY